MENEERSAERVQVEVSLDVFCRLLRERNLVASEVRYLNTRSSRAGWFAVKSTLVK